MRDGGGCLLSVFLFKNNRWVSGCFCQVFFMVFNLLPFLSYMNYNLSLSLGFSFQEKYAEFNIYPQLAYGFCQLYPELSIEESDSAT